MRMKRENTALGQKGSERKRISPNSKNNGQGDREGENVTIWLSRLKSLVQAACKREEKHHVRQREQETNTIARKPRDKERQTMCRFQAAVKMTGKTYWFFPLVPHGGERRCFQPQHGSQAGE